MKQVIASLKKSYLWTGIASFFLLLFGISGATLAFSSTCIFCLIPTLTFLLSIFGLSVGVISDYNYIFLSFGAASLGLTVFLFVKRGKFCKTCKVKKK